METKKTYEYEVEHIDTYRMFTDKPLSADEEFDISCNRVFPEGANWQLRFAESKVKEVY